MRAMRVPTARFGRLTLLGLLWLAAGGIGGCGDTPWQALPGVFGLGGDDPSGRPRPGRQLPLGLDDPAEEAATPGRSLWISLGRRSDRAGLLQELGERRLWRTDAGFVVATDGPRVVATSGLRQVLAATRFDGPDPLQHPAALLEQGSAPARRLVDLMTADRSPDGMRFGVEIECRLRAFATEEESVLLIEERCRGGGQSGGFTNRFWVGAGGSPVLRSEQWIGPGLPLLVLEPMGG
jgi:Group 4 capsule polysaccharide lipoprotein gfcB, YjbF